MMTRRGFKAWRKFAAMTAAMAAIIVVCAGTVMADGEKTDAKKTDGTKIDKIVGAMDNIMPGAPRAITIDDCVKIAILNNQELKMKQAILNSVDGDQMIDRSRFYSHMDFISDFSRDQGTLLKTYYPSYNPQAVSSLGTLDVSNLALSSGSSSSGGLNAASLGGLDVSQISNIASSFGIDISQFLKRPAATPAEMRAADRSAAVPIPGTNLDTNQLTQLLDLLSQIQNVNSLFSSVTNPPRTKSSTEVGIRYSRRLLEWGKDSSSSIQIQANRRLAIYNYQQKLREVVANTRSTFFIILLKKQQIAAREKLLGEYEERLRQQQKRFEVAQDVPKIDVLTAELDVLNEKNRISALKSDLVDKKYELLQITNMPYDANVEFVGEMQPLETSLKEVVDQTTKNSYQITYLTQEYQEDLRQFNQTAWDYKPILSGKIGVEDRRTAMGLTLNNANQTYGLDFGAAQFVNLPSNISSLSTRKNNNYNMSVGVTWNLYDNTRRKGVNKKFLENLNQTKDDLDRQAEIEELNARKAYNALMEAKDRLDIQGQIVENARKRLEITRKLRESGRVTEYQLDSLRDTFFSQEDTYFTDQENLITAQENLRQVMGTF